MIDVILLIVVLAVGWCVAGEGPFGAGLTLLCAVFGGLITMNFFETLAGFLASTWPAWESRADYVAYMALFGGSTILLRMAAAWCAPTEMELHAYAESSRWVLGAAAGYVTMAILFTGLHTAPLPREFLGFKPERKNFFDIAAPDRQWLGFTQHVTERVFFRYYYPDANNRKLRGKYAFDAMQRVLADKPNELQVLPSFLIRYADRRAQNTGAAAAKAAPQLNAAPSGTEEGGGTGAPANGGGAPSF